MKIRIHSVMISHEANGPGKRVAVWTQGCSFNCPGCFNPETHDYKAGKEWDVSELFKSISENSESCEGLTISGGEPFDQHEALNELLKLYKDKFPEKNIICFSGNTYANLRKKIGEENNALDYIDLLIAGPYVENKQEFEGLKASSNQDAVFLTDALKDSCMGSNIEFVIDEETGDMVSTGFPVGEFFNGL